MQFLNRKLLRDFKTIPDEEKNFETMILILYLGYLYRLGLVEQT